MSIILKLQVLRRLLQVLLKESGQAILRLTNKWKSKTAAFRIKLTDGSDIIPFDVVDVAREQTVFSFNPNALPESYPDRHYHLQLPNVEKYGGRKTKKI